MPVPRIVQRVRLNGESEMGRVHNNMAIGMHNIKHIFRDHVNQCETFHRTQE